jgi:dTDP-4-dehydrorhamnose 3,5-epimerase
MKVRIEETHIPDLVLVRREPQRDDRGYFVEQFRADTFRAAGLPGDFVQMNQSESRRGVVRGLHFQWDPPQGKLVRVAAGRAFVVSLDIRPGSPTLGQWHGLEMEASPHVQVWAPAGFARGFCALTDGCVVQYLCTGTYNAACEGGIRWDDPEVGIQWPRVDAVLSEKDRSAPTLAQWLERPEARHFRYDGGA